jgi:hypothetical protein
MTGPDLKLLLEEALSLSEEGSFGFEDNAQHRLWVESVLLRSRVKSELWLAALSEVRDERGMEATRDSH